MINSILYVLVTGYWMDMPVKYGSYKTAWDRFKCWSVRGVWADVFKALIDKGFSMGKLSLDKAAVESTTVKAKRGRWLATTAIRRLKARRSHACIT